MGWTRSVGVLGLALAGCDPVCNGCNVVDATVEVGVCGEPSEPLEPFYPLEEGAWWVHALCRPELAQLRCPHKLVLIDGPLGPVPGRPGALGYPARSARPSGYGLRWQEVTADGIIRHLDEWIDADTGERTKVEHFCPSKIRVDDGANACQGARWVEHITTGRVATAQAGVTIDQCARLPVDQSDCSLLEASEACQIKVRTKQKMWFVKQVDDAVSVPAGDFSAMRLDMTDDDHAKSCWWARGVGKVKETSALEDSEFLLDFCLPSRGCDRAPPDAEALQRACDEMPVAFCSSID